MSIAHPSVETKILSLGGDKDKNLTIESSTALEAVKETQKANYQVLLRQIETKV